MTPSLLRLMFLPLLLVLSQLAPSWGGEMVTARTREWARKAVAEEKALQTVPAQNSVAVLYFINKTGNKRLDPIRKGMALMLITDLSTVQELQVVERIKLQALVQELGLGNSGLVDPASAPRMGRLLGARSLVGGQFQGGEAKLQALAPVLDVPTTAVVGEPAATEALQELFRIEKELLFEIIALLKVQLSPAEQARLRKPCSTNAKALFALFQAVDASDDEDYEQAARLYERALKEDPGICIAQDALRELHESGVLAAKPASVDLAQSLRNDTSLTNQLTPKDEFRFVLTPKDVAGTTTNVDLVFPAAP